MCDKLKNLLSKRAKIRGEMSVLDKRFEECAKEIDEEFTKLSVKLDSLLDECWRIQLLKEEQLIVIHKISINNELIDKIEEETTLKLESIDSINQMTIAVNFKFE